MSTKDIKMLCSYKCNYNGLKYNFAASHIYTLPKKLADKLLSENKAVYVFSPKPSISYQESISQNLEIK